MNGQDKGLLKFNGETFVEIITRQLHPQCAAIMINANRNIARYEQLGFPVLRDQLTGFQGPLAGIFAGLKSIESKWLITVPCDGPYIDNDYVSKLATSIKPDTEIVVASALGRLQPVYALIRRSLTSSLEEYLGSGERKIDKWYFKHQVETVVFEESTRMFENINTPEELTALSD